jgi:hypothetical protein
MKNKKIRLVIISSILLVLMVAVLCTTTLMRLKSIDVQYVNTTLLLSQDDAEGIINSGNFEYGSNLLFTNYVKLIKLERKFPNKAVLHIEERTPVFRIHNSVYEGQYSVYDKDLKVLHVSNQSLLYSVTGENSVPILTFDTSYRYTVDLNLSAGEFLSDDLLKGWMTAIADGTYNYNATLTTIMSQIVLGKTDGNTTFTIYFDNSDIKATIIGDNNLQEKVYNVIKVFTEAGGEYANYDIYTTYDGLIFGQES